MKHAKKLTQRIAAGIMSTALLFTGSNLGFVKETTVSAADNDNYAKLLQYSLYFYDANMCGNDVQSKCALDWRGNCHTSDDVPGGYHDAGDHVMFGLPQGYAASTIGWSYYEYKDVYASLGLTDHFKAISKHFTDFFKKSTEMSGGSVSRFLYQKGEGGPDHAYWGAPETQGDRGKCYWVTSGASDIAAEYAAALALDYINFGDKESLDYAKALYAFSTRDNQVATDGTGGFYDSSSCKDDQAWAAAWLYVATKDQSYLSDAQSKNTQYLGWAHAWGNVDLGAACIIAEQTNDWTKVNGYLGSTCNGSGYLCMDGWGSARYNCCMQFVSLVASKHSNADYSAWAKGQMDIILGANGGQNYVVGWNDKSPQYCHHRAASGVSDCHDASPNKNVLVGALVGGPNAAGYYADKRDEYETNEVALDYQAGLVGAAAALYAQYKTGSTVSSIPGVGSVSTTPTTTEPTTTEPQQQTTEPTQQTTQPTQQTTQPTQQTTQPTQQTTQPTTQPSSGGEASVTEKTNQEGKTYWRVDCKGASSVTVTLRTNNSTDYEASGACNPSNASPAKDYWEPVDWTAKPDVNNNGEFTITYNNTTNADAVDVYVWWPKEGYTLVSAVKDGGSSSQTPTTQPDTQPSTQPSSGGEASVTEKTNQEGKTYWRVDCKGADEVTVTLRTNNSTDYEASGACNPSNASPAKDYWEPVDWTAKPDVNNNGEFTITYKNTTNADAVDVYVWWPKEGYTLVSAVKSGGNSQQQTTQATVATTSATTTTQTTTRQTETTPQSQTTTKATKYGDVNLDGTVDILDVIQLNKFLLGTKSLDDTAKANADVDNNNTVDQTDSLNILKFIVELETSFPVR